MDRRRIDFTFEVFDPDLTNENWMEYRETLLHAMVVYLKSGEASPDECRRIDKILCDCYRTEPTTYDHIGRPADDIEDEVIG